MQNQADINARMRTILLDWLVEVHLKFKLKDCTFFLAVNILDRFLTARFVCVNVQGEAAGNDCTNVQSSAPIKAAIDRLRVPVDRLEGLCQFWI